ncbi:MAG: hypothetical protein CSA52_02475 [Gammaproteobacteria bacterium]|nr:MAG: hypothetical protein CSB48_06460 [Pseudomonadota bacterium]PIE38450.1 MAG: hypothetical protein CSA52_02475 [Gammaproteobacteria bacterium]
MLHLNPVFFTFFNASFNRRTYYHRRLFGSCKNVMPICTKSCKKDHKNKKTARKKTGLGSGCLALRREG